MCTFPAYASYQMRSLSFVIRVCKMRTRIVPLFLYISRSVNVVVREKLIIPQLVKKFPTCYRSRRFIIRIHNSSNVFPILRQMNPVSENSFS